MPFQRLMYLYIFLFVPSRSSEHTWFHGLYASSSQSVEWPDCWHFCVHSSWLQTIDLFWRWRHCHPFGQVTEEKLVLCVESTGSAHWRRQVLVRIFCLLVLMCPPPLCPWKSSHRVAHRNSLASSFQYWLWNRIRVWCDFLMQKPQFCKLVLYRHRGYWLDHGDL